MIVALLGRGERWDPDGALNEQAEFEGHVAFMGGLRHRAVAIEVGPLSDPGVRTDDELFGLALLDLESVEAASGLMSEDPMVRGGVCSVCVYSWGGAEPLRR